jgi:phospholipase/carboxylesterase
MGAFDGLRDAPQSEAGLMAAYRALGQVTRAQEALYPLAAGLPPINRYFLDPASGRGEDLQARSLGEANPDTGVFHVKSEPGDRGGFSMYVPEYYTPDRAWPLVVALHGGSGNGRNFLWTWLRAARAHGAILAAPTASGETWALNARDADTPLLNRIVEGAKGRWNVDAGRVLMTGMSDGGTFSYLSGLRSGSVFTHLAPISAAFHPMMIEFADEQRIKGLPIFLTHGALDWMFPIQTAREAARLLEAAGANVAFHEIDDLSHTYPREINLPILEWMEQA